MRQTILGLAVTAVIAAALVAPSSADALTSRAKYVHATGVCQPSTPLELGGLRFRPLGVFNNKSSAIYISCTLDTEFVADAGSTDIRIYFANLSNVEHTVACTAVGGRRGVVASSVSAETVISADSLGSISFVDVDRINESFTAYGISCLLPPKVEMGLIRMVEDDVGNGL